MTDVTFVDGTTSIDSSWLNPVNSLLNDIFDGATTKSGAALAISALTNITNVGTGEGNVLRDEVPLGNSNLKTIKAGNSVSIIDNTDDITIETDVKRFSSVSTLAAESLTIGDTCRTISYSLGWESTFTGPRGGARYEIVTKAQHDIIRGYSTVNETGDHTLANGNVALLVFDEGLAITQFGAVGDGTTDDIAAIKSAVIFARTIRDSSGTSSTDLIFPSGKYIVSTGIPFIKGVNYITPSRWGCLISMTGSGSAMYTATLSGTAFTDNLNSILSDITTGGKEADNSSLINIHFEHTGTLAGNAPSGAAWQSVVNLVGCPDSEFRNVRVSSQTNSTDGFHLKYSWRAKVYNYYTSRGGAFSGGVGLYIDSECNSIEVYGPFVFGKWDIGIRSTNPFSVSIFEPHVEGASSVGAVGILMAGHSPRIFGGYLEGNKVDIQMGNSAATLATNWLIQGTWFNSGSSISDHHIDLDGANGGECIFPLFTGTIAVSEFKSNNVTFNKGNLIKLSAADASTPNLVSIGLDDGSNVVEIYGKDFQDHRQFKKYNTSSAAEVESELNQRGAKLTSFTLELTNSGGTIQHRIYSGDSAQASVYADSIVGNSVSYANTPLVDSVTGFLNGVGIISSNQSKVTFDTLAQINGECFITANIASEQSISTSLSISFGTDLRDIDGDTIRRAELVFYDAGTQFDINTANLTAGNTIKVDCLGFIK